MMHQTLSAPYGERDGVQLLRLGYVDSGLELLIALPGEEAGVGDVLDGLCTEGMDYFRFDEADARVALTMPKLDLSADSSLVAALRSLGVETPFGDAADFSGISEDGGPVYRSDFAEGAAGIRRGRHAGRGGDGGADNAHQRARAGDGRGV